MSESRKAAATGISGRDEFLKGLWQQNPVFVQALGMCPTLAVTNSAVNGLAMGLATAFVLLMTSSLVSLLRNIIPMQVRISVYVLIIASLVTTVDYLIEATSLDLHRALGAFIALIVVNCIILGRAEAFASRNKPSRAILDALGMGTGFTLGLLMLGGIREIIGQGSLFGYFLLPDQYAPWVVMLLPGGGFFVLGILLLLFDHWRPKPKHEVNHHE